MAYTNKLDTNVITITADPTIIPPADPYSYISSTGTIELATVSAYYTYVTPKGVATSYTQLVQNGVLIIVDETYATIDNLINP
tara:strand:- start:5790 stop:6038 length:249 start_codon:yes stop_codon:yes gene_type:complete